MKQNNFERHVVLVSPDVHWNTGNIGRTCIGTGAFLHLVKPLGFSIDSSQVKRAGLDYWPKVKLRVWENFHDFLEGTKPSPEEMFFFTKGGKICVWDMPVSERLFLVFGSETKGLPGELLKKYENNTCHIPITGDIRSLNLSTAAGIALYESLRNSSSFHFWK